MITNSTIVEKIIEKTKNEPILQKFILDIVNHENETSQYNAEYTKLIEKAITDMENKK